MFQSFSLSLDSFYFFYSWPIELIRYWNKAMHLPLILYNRPRPLRSSPFVLAFFLSDSLLSRLKARPRETISNHGIIVECMLPCKDLRVTHGETWRVHTYIMDSRRKRRSRLSAIYMQDIRACECVLFCDSAIPCSLRACEWALSWKR
jgi:hypothetical protein